MSRLLMVTLLVAAAGMPASAAVQSFFDYGNAVAQQFGAGGAVWDQTWGHPAWVWSPYQPDPNLHLLDANDIGRLETTTSGPPDIDGNMILRLPFVGDITLAAHDDGTPAQVEGQIVGTVAGTFVGDLNAANAVVDDGAGTITVAFGYPLHPGQPDALITVTGTTGTFADVVAVGPWEWNVSGTMTLARVPSLDVQTNILAALQNSALILGASEEVVLTGQYVPEPTTITLLGFAAAGVAQRRRRAASR